MSPMQAGVLGALLIVGAALVLFWWVKDEL